MKFDHKAAVELNALLYDQAEKFEVNCNCIFKREELQNSCLTKVKLPF